MEGIIGDYLFLDILHLSLVLDRHFFLAGYLLILDEHLHHSQHFLVLDLHEVEFLGNHCLRLIASQQLPELDVDLTDVEVRLSAEDIHDGVIVVQILREVLLQQGRLVVLRGVDGEAVRRLSLLKTAVEVRQLHQLVVPTLTLLQIAEVLRPEFALVEEADDEVDAPWHLDVLGPDDGRECQSEPGGAAELLLRLPHQLAAYLRSPLHDLPHLLHRNGVFRLDDIARVHPLSDRRHGH
jgi:hypothetical protein